MPATTVIDYAAGGEKRFDKAVVNSVNAADGFTTMQITMKPGFDWQAEISPKLPGCPKWCPATHFGFLKVRPSHTHAHTRACAHPHACGSNAHIHAHARSLTHARTHPRARTRPHARAHKRTHVRTSAPLASMRAQSGTMKVKYEDGSEATVHAGESYMIQPGHLPVVEGEEDAVMIEFSQASKKVLDKME